jgi:hypothetical protein
MAANNHTVDAAPQNCAQPSNNFENLSGKYLKVLRIQRKILFYYICFKIGIVLRNSTGFINFVK